MEIAPAVVIWPIDPPYWFVNQRAPSGPATIDTGSDNNEEVKTVSLPLGVIRSIEFSASSVNQTLPSGPDNSRFGPDLGVPWGRVVEGDQRGC